MNIEMNDGFNIVYAKIGSRPKRVFLEKRRNVVEFFMENLNDIDFISINDIIINKDELVRNNKMLSRYLKLKKIYEI